MAEENWFTRGDSIIREISAIPPVKNEEHGERDGFKKNQDHHIVEKQLPADHMRTILKAVEASNLELIRHKKPYRFCVYQERGEVIIDLILIDENGKKIDEVKRSITNEDFGRLIEDISSIEGLLYDVDG